MAEGLELLDRSPTVASARAALAGEERAWLVGGTVRDALLGRELADVDIVVERDPAQAARALAAEVDGPAFRLSEAFGGWRALDRSDGTTFDVTALHGATLAEDLARRDFSVNAMAVPLHGGALEDPHDGRADLDRGVLRVLGPQAYAADPLRPLRLARLAAELGMAPDPQTARLTAEAAPATASASGERIFAELRRIVASGEPVRGLELADELGLTSAVLPELAALHGVEQSHFHHLDVYDHTIEVLRRQLALEADLASVFGGDLAASLSDLLAEPLADEMTRAQALRFGALLHDIGKPATRRVVEGGRVTFLGHDRVGEEMVRALCSRLRTSTALSSTLARLAGTHLVLGFLVHHRPLSHGAVYDYMRATEPVEVEVTVLSCADRLATRGAGADAAIAAHLELARELGARAVEWRRAGPPASPVRGDELAAALGIEPGPELGRIIAGIERALFTGEVETRDQAIDLGRRLEEDAAG